MKKSERERERERVMESESESEKEREREFAIVDSPTSKNLFFPSKLFQKNFN